ncbi:MAG: DNA polymerase III subunit chi [Alphaproteobacteria bacterium]|nr:DNA polymerase III subunit chi [Alphaproteobacteria bacterium]
MSRVGFYHLHGNQIGSVLPKLLERVLGEGMRAVVIAPDEARVRALDRMLWTYESASWLPHGTALDGSPDVQPILLGTDAANPNGATCLFLTGGVSSGHFEGYDRVFALFDGNDDTELRQARALWRSLKDGDHELAYWRQDGRRWRKAG